MQTRDSNSKRILKKLGGLPALFFLCACAAETPQKATTKPLSHPLTHLGYLGNARAERRFHDYIRQQTAGCNDSGHADTRVLIQGFGPFNRSQNISGAVVRLLQNSELWPNESQWPEHPMTAPSFVPSDDPGQLGAVTVQRTITFSGQTFEVCLINTSVEWDLAAALVLHEANRFAPDFILLTGYGTHPTGLRIESGALNKTSTLSGYDPTGRYLTGVNTPESNWVIPPTLGLPENIKLSWVTAEIASQITPHLKRLNKELGRSHSSEQYHAVAMQDADPRNDYICNNMSYALAAALQTPTLPLAGQRLRLESKLNPGTGVGFVHYPKNVKPNDNHEVWLWAHVVLSLAQAALHR